MSDGRIEYDPTELLYRTPGAETGKLWGVSVWAEPHDGEMGFLLRRGEHDDTDPEELVGQAVVRYLTDRFPDYDPLDERADWEFDWGSARPGETGAWEPLDEAHHRPWEVDDLSRLFAVGEPPLGATRGRQGSGEDFRWLYVATEPGGQPDQPLKRLISATRELGRALARPQSWGRVNFPARNRSDLYLRLTPGTPRAAVLRVLDPTDPLPCRWRVDLSHLVRWLTRRVDEGEAVAQAHP